MAKRRQKRGGPEGKLNDLELDHILVKGAREHNLDIPELRIPKRKFVVLTGVSGSGKSSLAFDTVFAEGQRRYVESLSSYARQFLGQMEKPQFDHIRGLSPTIAIEQKTASVNPRSTVGTITEIADYLRVLYARVGVQHCYRCGDVISERSAAEIVELIGREYRGKKIVLLAPLVVARKGEHKEIIRDAKTRGFVRLRIDGDTHRLDGPDGELPKLNKKVKHHLELVVDRVKVKGADARLTDSVELALREGKGVLIVAAGEAKSFAERQLSEHRFCASCAISFPELSPQSFSFNTPLGACPECNGLGRRAQMDPALVVRDATLTLREGAIEPWASTFARQSGWTYRILEGLRKAYKIDFDRPWGQLPKRQRDLLLWGTGDRRVRVAFSHAHGKIDWNLPFEGIMNTLQRRFEQTQSEGMRKRYLRYFAEGGCTACDGTRLRPESRAVLVDDVPIEEVSRMTIAEAAAHFAKLEVGGGRHQVAAELVKEVASRLGFLLDVGLDYLSLERSGPSLSAGEAQRLRLASQLGAELSGVMYVLDEPTIGLHPRDCTRLVDALVRLRDLGNSVLAVEHDRETIERADHIIDFGPGAGERGGTVVFEGTLAALRRSKSSLTGRYVSGREAIAVPNERRRPRAFLTVKKARQNNLRGIDVKIPLGVLCAVTGVSGAGKSSLVNGILYPALMRHLHGSRDPVVGHGGIRGLDKLDKVIRIDQQPIGRTPRSNPATYTKAFDDVRDLFAGTPEARAYGFNKGRFSFNVRGGRCESCQGGGQVKVEMHFLADMWVTCQVCKGKRYNDATRRVTFKGLTIDEVLNLSVSEARELFAHHVRLERTLGTLSDVGLDYIKLGQPATTLSGGEAQRVKLSRELAKRSTGRTLYLLDEPTTGLHFDDVRKLLSVLDRLVEGGNTVLVIEHNLDVVKSADYLIDLGPEGGSGGGMIVGTGTPEEIVATPESYTGRALAAEL